MKLENLQSQLKAETEAWSPNSMQSKPSRKMVWNEELGLCLILKTYGHNPYSKEYKELESALKAEGKTFEVDVINNGYVILTVLEPLE